MNWQHTWSECGMCGPMVICGKCGNNCCNGGYGTLPDGSACDACPSAYDKQDAEYAEHYTPSHHFRRTTMNWQELATRCEQAEGPDRELDAEIARSQGWANAGDTWFDGVIGEALTGLPEYTASIDAALTLVPEGWETAIYLGGEKANVQMETPAMRDEFLLEDIIDATAKTPALAICAAALRASQQGGGIDGKASSSKSGHR